MNDVANYGISNLLGMMTGLSVIFVLTHAIYRASSVNPIYRVSKPKSNMTGGIYFLLVGAIYSISIPAGSFIFNFFLVQMFVDQGGFSQLWLVAGLDAQVGFVHPPSFFLAALAICAGFLTMIFADIVCMLIWQSCTMAYRLADDFFGMVLKLWGKHA